MDPLALLRAFVIRGDGQHVRMEDDRIHFADQYSFPREVRTSWKAKTTGQTDEFYTLEAILFCWRSRDVSGFAQYNAAAKEAGIKTSLVTTVDRKKVVDFLEGRLDASAIPAIQQAAGVVPMDAAPELEPPAKRARVEEREDALTMSSISAQERQLRTRNTMLLCSKPFEDVLQVLTRFTAKQAAAAQQQKQAAKPSGHDRRKPEQRAALPVKPSNRFDRDATAGQLHAMGDEGGKLAGMLNIYGTAGQTAVPQEGAGNGAATAAAAAPAAGAPPPTAAQQPARPTSTSSARPQPSRPSSSSAPAGGGSSSSSGGGVPIIIVPNSYSTVVNMYNAQALLERGTLEPVDAASVRSQPKPGASAPNGLVPIRRKLLRSGAGVEYMVTDAAPPSRSGFDRVVAVVLQAGSWAYRDWPFKGCKENDFVDLFQNVCGFYLHYSNEAVPDWIKKCRVKVIALARDSRHGDGTMMMDFYKHLDTFLQQKQCKLKY